MPSMNCKCGCRINFSDIPNSNEWLLIPDEEYDAIADKVDVEYLYRKFTHLFKCVNCGRLIIFWSGFESTPQYYNED